MIKNNIINGECAGGNSDNFITFTKRSTRHLLNNSSYLTTEYNKRESNKENPHEFTHSYCKRKKKRNGLSKQNHPLFSLLLKSWIKKPTRVLARATQLGFLRTKHKISFINVIYLLLLLEYVTLDHLRLTATFKWI